MPTDASQGVSQALADEQITNARAWEALKLRIAQNRESFDHFVQMTSAAATATAEQTGQTENEQAVTPIRTAAGDSLAAAAYPANRAIDTATATVADAAAGIATANQSIADAVANLVNALTAVVVTAAGGASTPSQTQAKPSSTTGTA